METSQKVTLRSIDGEVFEVEDSVIIQSETIKTLIEGGCANCVIPIPNVTGKVLAMVIEYCVNHAVKPAEPKDIEKLRKSDKELLKVDQPTLFELVLVAHYLNIKNLFDFACRTIGDEYIKGKRPDEIRRIFNIQNDFTPEEEEEIRRENAWQFE